MPLIPCDRNPLNIWVKISFPCIFMSIPKQIYISIMWSPKYFSFLGIFGTSCCTHICVLKCSIYCNTKNIIHLYVFLVKITVFGFACVPCLRVSKLPWAHPEIVPMIHVLVILNFTSFYELIKPSVQTHMKPTYALLAFVKWVEKWPTTQTTMAPLLRFYVIKTIELEWQAKYQISNSYLLIWSVLKIKYYLLRLIGVEY